jgi:Pyruvate/2-oxoacid:ferredoxin oxidoreductase gamma subunit
MAQIRYGEEVKSPLVSKRSAHILGALEKVEALRYWEYLRPDGLAAVSSQAIVPVTVSSGSARYPENAEELLARAFPRLVYIDAPELAKELGDSRAANIILLGAISRGLDLRLESWEKAIGLCVREKFRDLNLSVFTWQEQSMTELSKFHNESMETASRESIHEMQSRRLRSIVGHVYESNAVYRRLFDEKGIRPEDIRTAEDVVRLPLTSKDILRESYPLNMACVPRDQIVEMHMSSGSTGTPVVMPYTRSDLDQWAECMARCYRMSGAKPGDATQITPLFGLFNGGFGMYHGARAAGLFVIPAGPGNTARQIRLARDLRTRVFTGVVSYGIRLMEVLAEEKESLPELEIGIFGA